MGARFLAGLACISVIGLALACAAIAAAAGEEFPRSFVASPDVYKVIAEDEQYRIIEATWKPGQRDKLHSHGATVATYWLTDCHTRNHLPDGKATENKRKSGLAAIRAADLNHSVENIGTSICKVIIFEPK